MGTALFFITFVAVFALGIRKAYRNVKASGRDTTVSNVLDQASDDRHAVKMRRQQRKAELKAAKYARRHPGRIAKAAARNDANRGGRIPPSMI